MSAELQSTLVQSLTKHAQEQHSQVRSLWSTMDSVYLAIQSGARLDDPQCDQLRNNNEIPAWAYQLQTEHDKSTYTLHCVPMACLLMYVFRARGGGCPLLARHFVTHYILGAYKSSEWWHKE